MSVENMRVSIQSANDLLQVITEDFEESVIRNIQDSSIQGRASLTISSLYILSDFLMAITKEAAV